MVRRFLPSKSRLECFGAKDISQKFNRERAYFVAKLALHCFSEAEHSCQIDLSCSC